MNAVPRNRMAAIPVAILVMLACASLAAPFIAPYDPISQLDIVALKNAPPSSMHWLGTDAFSRDVLSRLLYGARTSLWIATLATALAIAVGAIWGATAAFTGTPMARLQMTAVDVLRSVPRILIMLGAVVLAGKLSATGLAVVIGLSGWAGMSRLVFVTVRGLLAQPFLEAAHSMGLSRRQILRTHILPHLISPVAAAGTLLLADVLALESGLSFLGLGVRAPAPSWGNMVQDAIPFLQSAWWLAAVPCVCLVVTVLSIGTVANQLSRRETGGAVPEAAPGAARGNTRKNTHADGAGSRYL